LPYQNPNLLEEGFLPGASSMGKKPKLLPIRAKLNDDFIETKNLRTRVELLCSGEMHCKSAVKPSTC